MSPLTNIDAVILDIEGTVGSISFVKEVLFPYAAMHLPDYVHKHADEPSILQLLQEVRTLENNQHLTLNECIERFLAWIQADKKITPLKTLQGMIWKDGFIKGSFTGHLYADAYQAMRFWHESGMPLFIYSSGSITAQKLYFQYSGFGNLLAWFAGYFDTTIGSKLEAASYLAIADAIQHKSERLLFFSDNLEELDAARQAGLQTMWVNRSGLAPNKTHPEIKDFSQAVTK